MTKIMLAVVVVAFLISGCTAKVETKGEGGISDSDVTSNVEKVLASTEGINPDQVDVRTNNGEVTLDGQVSSSEAKDRVSEVVSVVKGVDKVDNNLEVKPPAPSGTGAGSETTQQPSTQQPVVRREPQGQQQGLASEQQVKNALKNSNALSGVNMNVRTQDGTVILSGTVPNQASKELAERIARQQQGVTSVQNNLQVRQQ